MAAAAGTYRRLLAFLRPHAGRLAGNIAANVVGAVLDGVAFLLLIPFLDRRTARGEPSRLFTWIGVAIIAYMLLFTYLGYTASATK